MQRYPMKLQSCLVEKIWGGDRLSRLFPVKEIDPEISIGESWEMTARSDQDSTILNGPYSGEKLSRLIARFGDLLVGINGLDPDTCRFPLLLKFLDASDVLSVQVHPDDEYALAHENDLGKMEAWYIISAEEGAELIKGVKPGTDRELFTRLLNENKLEECLNSFPVRPGDVVFLPPRTLHAIGKGLVLFEIQQSSDVTYRAYDWGRVGDDGRPRDLHVDSVLEVTDFDPPAVNMEDLKREEGDCVRTLLLDTRYFVFEEIRTSVSFSVQIPDDRFIALTCVSGSCSFAGDEFETVDAAEGETVLLPAGTGSSVSVADECVLLASYVPPVTDWFRGE